MRTRLRFASLLLALIACTPASRLEPLPAPDQALDDALARLRDVEAVERPWVAGGFIYYTRVDEKLGRVYCRRATAPGSSEQLLFTAPAASLGAFGVSPDQRWLAFSTRGEGDRYSLHLKDLANGSVSAPIEGTDFTVAWSPDSTLFFAGLDDKDRPKKVFAVKPASQPKATRSASGAAGPALAPTLVHEEKEGEVLVAPLVGVDEEGAGLFVRAPRRVLGYRLHGARELEGLPMPLEHEGHEPRRGGGGLGAPPPPRPAAR